MYSLFWNGLTSFPRANFEKREKKINHGKKSSTFITFEKAYMGLPQLSFSAFEKDDENIDDLLEELLERNFWKVCVKIFQLDCHCIVLI